MTTNTILLVEDEIDLINTLEYNLKREGYHVLVAQTAHEALHYANEKMHAIILDVMLPDLSGIEICRRLRAQTATAAIPILMLTAKGEESDRICGFEVGADDYVVKPFSVKELLLRIRSLLRRKQSEDITVFGKLRLDENTRCIFVDEQECVLTALEFKLLKILIQRKEQVQSRDQLLNDVWEITANITTRTVDTHVKRLRQKLGVCAHYIQTHRAIGYRFTTEEVHV